MFGLFKRGAGGGSAKPSFDAIRFDDTEYACQGEPQPGLVVVALPTTARPMSLR